MFQQFVHQVGNDKVNSTYEEIVRAYHDFYRIYGHEPKHLILGHFSYLAYCLVESERRSPIGFSYDLIQPFSTFESVGNGKATIIIDTDSDFRVKFSGFQGETAFDIATRFITYNKLL